MRCFFLLKSGKATHKFYIMKVFAAKFTKLNKKAVNELYLYVLDNLQRDDYEIQRSHSEHH